MGYENKIAVMDSGVGGLSILSELKKALPEADFVYFGDTKNLPYGTKTPDEILEYNIKILDYFKSLGIKNVVIACNTTSALTYDTLLEKYTDLNIYPLIQSLEKALVEGLRDDDCIVNLATALTAKSKKYSEVVAKGNKNIKVCEIPCTGFVEIVENRLYETKEAQELIEEKMLEANKNNPKRIILGCTHYPYLINLLSKHAKEDIFFNPAKSLAQIVKKDLSNLVGNSKVEFLVSKDPLQFKNSAKLFFEIKDEVKEIILK